MENREESQKLPQFNLLSFKEVIEGKSFQIPDYQRGYSWDTDQVDDLSKDIENLMDSDSTDSDSKHFTGTIVAVKADGKKDAESEEIYEIVDGQQRLTTLVILLMTIAETYGEFRTICYRGSDGNQRPLLKANKETEKYFHNLIYRNAETSLTEGETTKSHLKIKQAKERLHEWLKPKTKYEIDKIVKTILERLGFLFFVPENRKEVGIMFEVINNRGKPLSELEKIKNYFIYYCTVSKKDSLSNDINLDWGDIQKRLNMAGKSTIDEENSFLRNCYLVFFDPAKSKSWSAYDSLKEKYNSFLRDSSKNKDKLNESIEEIKGFVSFLKKAAYYYVCLFNTNENNWRNSNWPEEVPLLLKRLRCHPVNASILPLYLAIMSYTEEKDKEIQKKVWGLLKILEILNFRVYLLPKVTSRADSRQGTLFEWAHEIFHKRKGDTTLNWGYGELIDFTKKMCLQKKFVESLTIDIDESEDYYYWKGLRYFLAVYEAQLQQENKKTWDIQKIGPRPTGKLSNDRISAEHIWAKNNRKGNFPEDHIQKRRLGNFVLMELGNNISLKDGDIKDKIDDMKDKSSFALCQVDALQKHYQEAKEKVEAKYERQSKNYYKDLSAHLNDLRETELVKFALEQWKLPGEDPEFFKEVNSFSEAAENTGRSYILAKEPAGSSP